MIASNKQKQEHNNLATIWRALQEPLGCHRIQMKPSNNGQGSRLELLQYNNHG